MRGHLELLIPDVERSVGGRPKNVAQYCALAWVGEAGGSCASSRSPALMGRPPTRGAWPAS
nr:hypothetical protein [Streptomyces sp. NBC_00878]